MCFVDTVYQLNLLDYDATNYISTCLGITSFDLTATVTSPGGVTEDAEINEVEDGLYAVHFIPKELGVHTVSVKYKDIHIPGRCDWYCLVLTLLFGLEYILET